MRRGLLGTEAGVGTDGEFGEFGLGLGITRREEGAEPSSEETDGNADDARIAQRERGVFAINASGTEQD
jgi:hypothetical protein